MMGGDTEGGWKVAEWARWAVSRQQCGTGGVEGNVSWHQCHEWCHKIQLWVWCLCRNNCFWEQSVSFCRFPASSLCLKMYSDDVELTKRDPSIPMLLNYWITDTTSNQLGTMTAVTVPRSSIFSLFMILLSKKILGCYWNRTLRHWFSWICIRVNRQ